MRDRIQDIPIEELIVHRKPMRLIDHVLLYEEPILVAEATIHGNTPFTRSDGSIPVWIGLEFMAQTIAAYSGVKGGQTGEPAKVGFLVGTRSMLCRTESYIKGQTLEIEVMHDGEVHGTKMAVFDCRIRDKDTKTLLMDGRVNVYQPEHIETFVAGPEVNT